ncbi:hypothetical protein [Herbiconiux sp. A18JL235]|uniref:DUF559 domain-containing protein n=1 Tax=Herbiconiux sp. A18JL235 TaxID=3152363 RepID=A0AB39BKR8_9MICO
MSPVPARPLPLDLEGVAFSVGRGAQAGLSKRRMRAGDLDRPFHGVRRRRGAADNGLLAVCRAYAVRMKPAQAFSHETAAALWGVPLDGHRRGGAAGSKVAPDRERGDARPDGQRALHVSALHGGPRPRCAGVTGHVLSDPAVFILLRQELPVVDPATVWLQLAATSRFDELVAAGDHLVLTPRRATPGAERPYTTVEELRRRVSAFSGRGRRLAVEALPWIRDGAESARETRLRLNLVRWGLPEPVLNAAIRSSRGAFIAFGDLVYPEFKVLVEYEGEQHRTDARQFYRDIERHEALQRAGWVLIRETKESPRVGPRSAPTRAARALRARGWRG